MHTRVVYQSILKKMCSNTDSGTEQGIEKPKPEDFEHSCNKKGNHNKRKNRMQARVPDIDGRNGCVCFVDCIKDDTYIRHKCDSDNNPWRIPARVTGKDHANNYRERSGIDNMLDIHVLKYGRNEQIKDDSHMGGFILRVAWYVNP